MKYLIPKKLQEKFLLGGLTIPELLLAILLFFIAFVTAGLLEAIVYVGLFCVFCIRLLDGKSLKDSLLVVFRYHSDAQFFTVHLAERKKYR